MSDATSPLDRFRAFVEALGAPYAGESVDDPVYPLTNASLHAIEAAEIRAAGSQHDPAKTLSR